MSSNSKRTTEVIFHLNKGRKMMGPTEIVAVEAAVIARAAELEAIAARLDAPGDQSANNLLAELQCWLDGVAGRIPNTWLPFVDQAVRTARLEHRKKRDPKGYQQYITLKEKFEGTEKAAVPNKEPVQP